MIHVCEQREINRKIVKMLVKHGAFVCKKDKKGRMVLSYVKDNEQNVRVRVLDFSGVVVLDNNFGLKDIVTLDLGSYSNGLFIVEIFLGNEVIRKKVIKN